MKIKKREVLMGDLFQPFHLLILFFILFIVSPLMILPYWYIFKKAGFTPMLSVLMIFPPPINLLVVYYVAFSPWKIIQVQQTHVPIEPIR